jgi:hypothetical protein
MALLQDDTSTTYWLVEFAKDLQAKADEAESNGQGDMIPIALMDQA